MGAFVLHDLLILASESEGVPPDHIASTIVPIIGALFFCGSVYILLWSIYGAKKGALIYGTAFFAFGAVIGVYWWFGAPGTPIATGPKYLPYQESDRYQGEWFAMEAGSERAAGFEAVPDTRDEDGEAQPGELPDVFQTPQQFTGLEGASPAALEADPGYSSLVGDLESGTEKMLQVYLPRAESGTVLLGQQRRARLMERAPPPQEGEEPASPFFQARVATTGEGEDASDAIWVTEADDRGIRVAAARLQITANYMPTDPNAPPIARPVVVEESFVYAFKDPGALWFPSAVWTGISALLFFACLFGLDRVEQREKTRVVEREPVAA